MRGVSTVAKEISLKRDPLEYALFRRKKWRLARDRSGNGFSKWVNLISKENECCKKRNGRPAQMPNHLLLIIGWNSFFLCSFRFFTLAFSQAHIDGLHQNSQDRYQNYRILPLAWQLQNTKLMGDLPPKYNPLLECASFSNQR